MIRYLKLPFNLTGNPHDEVFYCNKESFLLEVFVLSFQLHFFSKSFLPKPSVAGRWWYEVNFWVK